MNRTVVAPEAEVLDLHRRRAGERVEAVQHALRLARVVPEVNSSWASASGAGARAAIAVGVGRSWRRAPSARSCHCTPRRAAAGRRLAGAADHEHVLDAPRPSVVGASSTCGLGQVVAAAEARRGRPTPAPASGAARATTSRSRKIGISGQQTAPIRSARQRQHDELAPVRQLVGDRLAGLARRARSSSDAGPVGRRVQLAPGPGPGRRRRGRRRSRSPCGRSRAQRRDPVGDRDLRRLVDRDRLDRAGSASPAAGGARSAPLRSSSTSVEPDRASCRRGTAG